MAMNFDTYNTSFQSLMKPMYNVNANYAMGLGGYPGAAGMYGSGYMNPAMMGRYAAGPLSGVGVGQFNASYLLPAEDQMNNYYARPVAAHKKENETGTILGILGTALGTAAMLAALAKGKFRRAPKAAQSNTASTTANNQTSSLATTNNTGANPTGGGKTSNITTQTSNNNTPPASTVAGALPPHISRRQYALNKLQAASNLPSSGNVIVTPPPALPASGSAAATGSSTANLPAVVPKPVQNPVNPSNIATQNVPSVVSQNIKLRPIEEYINHQNQFNIPDKWIKGSLPLHAGTQQAAASTAGSVKALPKSAETLANEKLIEVRPDLGSQGAVVHTTHTPESIANGYSIASNAKGGDKLAALLAQMES